MNHPTNTRAADLNVGDSIIWCDSPTGHATIAEITPAGPDRIEMRIEYPGCEPNAHVWLLWALDQPVNV